MVSRAGAGPSHDQRRSNAKSAWEAFQSEEGIFSRTKSRALSKLGKSGISKDSSAYQSRSGQIQTEYDTSLGELKGGRMFKELQDFYVDDIARGQTDAFREDLFTKYIDEGENYDWDHNRDREMFNKFKSEVDPEGMQKYYSDQYGDTTIKEERQFTTDERGSIKTGTSERDKRPLPGDVNATPIESEWV